MKTLGPFIKFGIPGFLLFCVMHLAAQTYHSMPSGPSRWDGSRCWYFYPGGWHDLYYIEMTGEDTILFGRIYKKLFHTTHHLPGTEFDSTYTHFLGGLREENRQVFMLSEFLCLDTIERMIYDFKEVSAGDTIYTQILTHDLTQFIPHIVTSTDQVMVDGQWHRQIHLSDDQGFFTESWIEGVGSTQGLIYASYGLLTDNSYDLHCFYEEGSLSFMRSDPGFAYCTPPFPDTDCDPVITSPGEDPDKIIFSVYPNPAWSSIFVASSSVFESASIYNILGMQVLEQPFASEISIDHLASGLYFLQLTTAQGRPMSAAKFVKL